MKIYKYIHSCILLEEQGRGLLFDPGIFSFMDGHAKPELFVDLDAIVITHTHPDHLDITSLQTILGNNPQAAVITNTEIAKELQKVHTKATVLEGGSLQAGVFTIEALPARHAAVLWDALPQNIAYRVNGTVLHPGDSFSEEMLPWQSTRVLLLPIAAPWLTEPEAYTFAKTMQPQVAIPIHDGYIKDFFLQMRYGVFQEFLQRANIQFMPVHMEEPYELV